MSKIDNYNLPDLTENNYFDTPNFLFNSYINNDIYAPLPKDGDEPEPEPEPKPEPEDNKDEEIVIDNAKELLLNMYNHIYQWKNISVDNTNPNNYTDINYVLKKFNDKILYYSNLLICKYYSLGDIPKEHAPNEYNELDVRDNLVYDMYVFLKRYVLVIPKEFIYTLKKIYHCLRFVPSKAYTAFGKTF